MDSSRSTRPVFRFLLSARGLALVVATGVLLPTAAVAIGTSASGPAAAAPAAVPLLPLACETGLALAAAPEHLRAEATVYAFTAAGYERVQQGDNGFTCIVNRDHPYVYKPTCFDAEGSATIVPKILRFGELLAAGEDLDAINAEIAAGFADGTFVSPRRPGVAYMLSDYNRPYSPTSDSLGWFPPHLMFYAPDLTGEDIGFSLPAWRANRRLPMIGYQGAHGYMIVTMHDDIDPSRTVLPSCPAWLGSDRPWSESAPPG